jgi:hypothetical protein
MRATSRDTRVSARASGYMELGHPKKDGDCKLVNVNNGISKDSGCCNLFKPGKGAKVFSCGTCKYVT